MKLDTFNALHDARKENFQNSAITQGKVMYVIGMSRKKCSEKSATGNGIVHSPLEGSQE